MQKLKAWPAANSATTIANRRAWSKLAFCARGVLIGPAASIPISQLMPFDHGLFFGSALTFEFEVGGLRVCDFGCQLLGSPIHMHDLVHDLGDWFAVGAAVLEGLRRLAVECVTKFLDGLHVAGRSLFDVRAC